VIWLKLSKSAVNGYIRGRTSDPQDYNAAAGNADQKCDLEYNRLQQILTILTRSLAAQGITLTNYFGVTHPSEPNYVGMSRNL